MHVALWVLAATSLLGAGVCLLRPSHDADDAARSRARRPVRDRAAAPRSGADRAPPPADRRASAPERAGAAARESLRIGDVARLAGTTPRTIRYYEEIGLLPEARRAALRAAPPLHRRPRSSACAR